MTTSHTLTAGLLWAPDEGPRNDASVSVTITTGSEIPQITATLDNQLTMSLSDTLLDWLKWDDEQHADGTPYADLTVDTTAELRRIDGVPDFSTSTTGRIFASLPPNWSVSLAATYSLGVNSTIGLYHGALLEITFAIDF